MGISITRSNPTARTKGREQPSGTFVLRIDPRLHGLLRREWEAGVPPWDGRDVDLHFVHLPDPAAAVSGSWAEAAVCGIVLYDRDLVVSRRLIAIRGRIASGELVRRMAQGQPYWIHEGSRAQS